MAYEKCINFAFSIIQRSKYNLRLEKYYPKDVHDSEKYNFTSKCMKKLITKYPNPTIYNLFIKMAPECEKVNMYFI